jgi:hypothetical protein
MTVASNTSRIQYNCSGGTEYDFTFGVGETSEIQVILTDAAEAETTLTETTHYTVSATNNDFSSGGTVTTVAAYAAGNKITILRNVPITQESDYVEGMEALYETFEDGLDKLTRIAQQIQERLTRSPYLPASATASAALPIPVANGYLAFNADASAIEARTIVEGEGSISDEAYSATWYGAASVAPSKNALYNALLQTILTTAGDIAYASAANVVARLPIGADGALFGVNDAGALAYKSVKISNAGAMTGVISIAGLTTPLTIAQGGSGSTGDSIIKGWIQFTGAGVIAIQDSFNVASITDNGTGNYTVTWDTDFANDDYACIGNADDTGESVSCLPSAGSVSVRSWVTMTGDAYDSGLIMVMAIGDQ